MSGEDDVLEVSGHEKVLTMKRGQFSLKDLMTESASAKPAPEKTAEPSGDSAPLEAVPGLDDLSPLPLASEGYKAHSRASNRPVPTLLFLLADASTRGFSYANLDTLDLLPATLPGQGPVIVARFHGITPMEISISGRNLDTLYLYLGFHRLTWIRQLSPSRDFISEKETVIIGITISKLKE